MRARKRIASFFMASCLSVAGVMVWSDTVYAQKIASTAQAEEKALQKVKNATVTDVGREYEDGVQIYEVELVKNSKKYEIAYRASDGKMIAYSWEKRNVSAAGSKPLISKKKCRNLALRQVKNGEILSMTFKTDDGIDIYKVKVTAGNKKYTLKYHARTAALIDYEWKITNLSSKTESGCISTDKAQEIALAKVPGAAVVKTEFEMDDGIPVYEVELIKGNYEYEFKIHAQTGRILEQEKDLID